MIKKSIILILALVVLGGTMVFAAQEPPPFPVAFWLNGKLDLGTAPPTTDLSSFEVVFYSTTGLPGVAYASAYCDANGNFAINVLDDMRLDFKAGNYFIGVVKNQGYGVNETALPVSPADVANGAIVLPFNLSLAAGAGINDPEGPQAILKFPLTIILKGFYQKAGTVVSLEARDGTQPNNATTVQGTASVEIDSNGYVISVEANTLPTSGQYYLVVKHPKGDSSSIHLPIITANKIDFGATTAIDLGTAAIYGDDGLAAEGSKPSVYIDTVTTLKMMWPGDMLTPFGLIDAADFSFWNGKYLAYMGDNTKYDPQADLNGDGKIDAEDFSLFNGAYLNFAGSGQSKHSYVPNYQ